MGPQYTLVRIYLFVCQHYRGRLAATTQRQSNNDQPDFTDEEVLTIYLFGLFKNRETVSDIHAYTEDHFSDWFPDLPSYQSYNRRLNRLSAVFSPLIEKAGMLIFPRERGTFPDPSGKIRGRSDGRRDS